MNLELRARLIQACATLLNGKRKVGIILSGGVDTGAVLAASCEAVKLDPSIAKIEIAISVFASPEASDRAFAIRLAKEYGLTHVCIETTCTELLNTCLRPTVHALRSFDPMNGRNSLVIERALQCASADFPEVELWLTGDAADELFGGYSFTYQAPEPKWSQDRNEMCMNWMFTTDVLAKEKQLCVLSPFRDRAFVNWAIAYCNKAVCVGDRMLVAQANDVPELRLTGKVVLRDAFPENTSSNRRKDPIELGSGCHEFRNGNEFFVHWCSANRTYQPLLDLTFPMVNAHAVHIRELEHAIFYQCFTDLFPLLLKSVTTAAREEEDSHCRCKSCHFPLATPTTLFCRMCGEYPAQV